MVPDTLVYNRVQEMLCVSHWFHMGTLQGLDIHEELVWKDDSMRGEYFQQWLSALLLSTQRLASLSVRTDGVPWSPVLGRLSVRHLELTMREVKPWLHVIMADLSLCSSLETLTIEDDLIDHDTISKGLPDVFLHDVTTLKTVEFVGWYPEKEFTLPPGCMLHLVVIMESQAQWHGWQEKGSTSMLYLVSMKLETWPAGIQDLSGLRYLELYCKSLQDQDLADLQHIPYVSLVLEEFSTFLVTNGSWQSLKISGYAGFNVRVSNVDAFVRDTQRFLFESTSQEAAGMYKELRAACMRQGVACHECDHVHWYEKAPAGTRNATLSNLKLCRASERVTTYGSHESFICIDPSSRVFPHRATYPELYC